MKVDYKDLERYAEEIMLKGGFDAEEAAFMSKELVLANLVGYDSHGVIRIPQYLDQMKMGKIVPGAKIEIVKETATTAIVDGHLKFGQMVGYRMADIVMEKAKKYGVGVAVSLNAAHAGRVGSYVEYIAKNGFIGFCTASLCYDKPLAPWGAKESRMGTNPISWAVPRKDSFPVFMDGSMTVCAEGKVRTYVQKGLPVPEGWIMDGEGHDTTDPMALYRDPPGTIYPVGGKNSGGVKGSALAVMANMFSLALANDDYWSHEKQLTENGIFIMAIDPEAFCGLDAYKAQVLNHSNYIKSAAPADGFDKVMMPGEYEHENYDRLTKEGIELPPDTWNGLVKIAKELNCEWSKDLEAVETSASFVRY